MKSYNFGRTNLKEDLKVYFKIDYNQKEEAKKEGYRFDFDKSSWYKLYETIEIFKSQQKFKYPSNKQFNSEKIHQYILLKNINFIANRNKIIIE